MVEPIEQAPEPVLRFVMVPVKFKDPVVNFKGNAPPGLLKTKLFFPVIPPLKVVAFVVVAARVIVPVAFAISESTMGLAKVLKSPSSVTLELLATESPRVIMPVPEPPKALALVVPLTVPALMVKPPVKVLAPERVSVPAPFWVRPPAPLIMPLKVVLPAPTIVNR